MELITQVISEDAARELERIHATDRARLVTTLALAAQAALATARQRTPVKTGRAQRNWRVARASDLVWLLLNNDSPPKLNWLEGRARMARRGEAAAYGVLARAGFGSPPALDFTPLW